MEAVKNPDTENATSDAVSKVCDEGAACVDALLARIGGHLESAWYYRPWMRRDVSFEDVGGWYLYDSLYATYAVADVDPVEPTHALPAEPVGDMDWEGVGAWNSYVPLLNELEDALEAVSDGIWESEGWELWDDLMTAYNGLYQRALERSVKEIVRWCDCECEEVASGETLAA